MDGGLKLNAGRHIAVGSGAAGFAKAVAQGFCAAAGGRERGNNRVFELPQRLFLDQHLGAEPHVVGDWHLEDASWTTYEGTRRLSGRHRAGVAAEADQNAGGGLGLEATSVSARSNLSSSLRRQEHAEPQAAPKSEKHSVVADASMRWTEAGIDLAGTHALKGSAESLCRKKPILESLEENLRGSVKAAEEAVVEAKACHVDLAATGFRLRTSIREDPVEAMGKEQGPQRVSLWDSSSARDGSEQDEAVVRVPQVTVSHQAGIASSDSSIGLNAFSRSMVRSKRSSSASWHRSHLRVKWTAASQTLAVANPNCDGRR